MEVITIEKIKLMLRIETDEENGVLEKYGNRAEEIVQEIMGRDFEEIRKIYGHVHVGIIHACLIVAEKLYMFDVDLTPSSMRKLPFTIGVLLEIYSKKGIMQRMQSVNLETWNL